MSCHFQHQSFQITRHAVRPFFFTSVTLQTIAGKGPTFKFKFNNRQLSSVSPPSPQSASILLTRRAVHQLPQDLFTPLYFLSCHLYRRICTCGVSGSPARPLFHVQPHWAYIRDSCEGLQKQGWHGCGLKAQPSTRLRVYENKCVVLPCFDSRMACQRPRWSSRKLPEIIKELHMWKC